ncbi:topoisomerase II-associated protein PAT1 [Fimicolochytrium jonesii]|uniref:topoisomerase II-associated protein PAT1 n=1 Tax=Fimicolochytrium jonesii TaxID=1396493 RepID=UPI0022FEF1D3|nr:topoisomerase II-associated protein PAT1 [Fimicolochytrium jonesii]KAI8822086.1 topoisomerase II-associated protein PAT1 [Fimicolochytrium jonesii]
MASFFGFNTALPGRDTGRRQQQQPSAYTNDDTFGDELGGSLEDDVSGNPLTDGNASRVDELMEQKYAYGDPADVGLEGDTALQGLEDDNESLNDETFGGSAAVENVGQDFDFAAGGALRSEGAFPMEQRRPSERQQPVHGAYHDSSHQLYSNDMPDEVPRRPSELNRESLAEIWGKENNAGPSRDQQQHHVQTQPHPSSHYGTVARPVTLEELEAQMRRQRLSARPDVPPHMQGGPGPQMGGGALDNARLQGYAQPQMDPRLRSVEEIEALMRAQREGGARPQQGPAYPIPQQGPQYRQQQQYGQPLAERQAHPDGRLPMSNVYQQQPPNRNNSPQQIQQQQQQLQQQQRERQFQYVDNENRGQQQQRSPMQLGHFLPPQQRGPMGSPQHQHQHQQQQQFNQQGYGRYDQQQQRGQFVDRRPDIRTREEKYRGTMTQREKELIAKIQISQLVTDNPYRDDFYYIVYKSLTSANQNQEDADATSANAGKSAKGGLNWQQSLLMDQTRAPGSNATNKMQQQMQRLIEGRKQKAKGNSLSLEGALGKIALSSVRNPRQILQVDSAGKENKDANPAPKSAHHTPKQVLKQIEKAYSDVLELEVLKRQGPPTDGENVEEETEAYHAKISNLTNGLWRILGVAEPVPLNYPHPLAAFLSYAKGKKVFPRVFRFLPREHALAVITTILARLESLDVCKPNYTPDDLELFMGNVVPTVVTIVMDLPLFVVNACMRIILERHNMVWVAKTKPGLAFLTMFLSRAEMVKQGAGGPQGFQVAEQELSMWTEIYNFLFASLHNSFANLFPSSVSNASNSFSNGNNSSNIYAGDVYVWQFLAALAVGATTVDHQRVLLTEVRDKVLETARRTDDPKSLANVNLFLNALGLGIDARQLVDMSSSSGF